MEVICFVLASNPPFRLLYSVWDAVLKILVDGNPLPLFQWHVFKQKKEWPAIVNNAILLGLRCTGIASSTFTVVDILYNGSSYFLRNRKVH